jgi:hypothetical protein
MRFTIQLDDNFGFGAIEISNVLVNTHLASKLKTIEAPISQAIPELLLGGRGSLPHPSRKFE